MDCQSRAKELLDQQHVANLQQLLGVQLHDIWEQYIESVKFNMYQIKVLGAHHSDPERLRLVVHSLKGASANVGAKKVYQISLEIEYQLKNKIAMSDWLKEQLDQLEKVAVQTCDLLVDLIDNPSDNPFKVAHVGD